MKLKFIITLLLISNLSFSQIDELTLEPYDTIQENLLEVIELNHEFNFNHDTLTIKTSWIISLEKARQKPENLLFIAGNKWHITDVKPNNGNINYQKEGKSLILESMFKL